MATGRIDRTDDTAATLKIIATVDDVEDAVTKQWQGVVVADATVPADNKLAIDASGNAQVIAAANSGTDIGDTTVNNGAGGSAVNVQDGGNSLTVDWDNTISTNNSSTATLNADLVFTGTGDDVSTYGSVSIMLDASHDSATDGMTFQFSTDDSNWDDIYTFTYTAADGARRFQFAITGQFFRVVYTNGGTNQTHMRIQTILNRAPITSSIHRAVDNIDPDRSAQLVKSIVIAQAAGSGDFVPVQATAAGNFKMSIEEFDAAVTGAGATDAQTQRVVIANDDPVSSTLAVVGGGTEAAALRVTVANDSTGVLPVTNAIGDGWDNGASDGASVSGDTAHSAADAGEPVKVGHKAIDTGADPTEVASDERSDWYSTRAGIPFTIGGHPNVLTKHLNITDADGAQTDTNMLAGATGAGDVAVVTGFQVTADSANTGAVSYRFGFGAAATPALDAAKMVSAHPGVAAGSGVVMGNGAGILAIGANGEDLFMDCEDPAGGSIDFVVHYFIMDNS